MGKYFSPLCYYYQSYILQSIFTFVKCLTSSLTKKNKIMSKHTFFFFVIVLLWILPSCDFETTSDGADDLTNTGIANTPTTETPTEETPPTSSRGLTAPPTSYTMEAGKYVGQITADATEEDIIKSYGEDQVQRREIGLGEGETTEGSVVFPGTENELIIEWAEGETYQKIKSIRIDGEKAEWTTIDGIHVGTTLEELKAINGAAFKFYGFEWDYAGTTNEWNDGKIDKNCTVILTPSRPEAAFPDLLGDQLFSSEHPKAEAAGLIVSSITIDF